MKSINLLYRHPTDGISIQKVFNILYPYFNRFGNVYITEVPCKGSAISSIIMNLIYALRHRKRNSINHITGAIHYLSYVCPSKYLLTTVHDLNRFIGHSDSWIKKRVLSVLFLKALEKNRIIVCISEKTKTELLNFIDFPRQNIYVIPDPISDKYIYTPKEFNGQFPKILHIGTKTNKNLDRTVEALKTIKCELRIIGELNERDKILLKKNRINYVQLNKLSEEELLAEYAKCDIVNFPSTYEGFGMPIIEAQAIGRVCLTSDIEPMNSVCGEGGAYLVDPFSIASIRQGYIEIISNEKLREDIISAGLENVKKYRAKAIAEEYSKIYQIIADESSSFGAS